MLAFALVIALTGGILLTSFTAGAYLIVCVFFSTLFNKSATVLDNNGLAEEVANAL